MRVLLLALLLAAGAALAADPDPVGPDKVVYHLNLGLDQASAGLRNVRNHLEVNPKAKIVVVTHSLGVDFLMKGMKDKNGNPYETIVQTLEGDGVRFELCLITLRERKLKK